MHPVDYTIIVLYFALVIGIGVWFQRAAGKNLDSYFLGGKSMHWLALAMSGSVATFDITGTMWIVTLIVLFGMKSMWNHWMWGFLMAAFFMSYMGKWVRRSNVMTGAEWMVTRFGDRADGRVARAAYTLLAVVMLTGFIGYAFQGIGKFSAVYLDIQPLMTWIGNAIPALGPAAQIGIDNQANVLAVAIFTVTTLYVLLGGLYGVVATNVIQTVILTAASILIAVVAYRHLSPEILAGVRPADGTSLGSLLPCWKLPDGANLPAGYTVYAAFGPLVVMWVVKGLLLNLGGPGQMTDFQVFLATRNAREASKLGAAWSGFLVVRWAMCMGIALLALTGLTGVDDPEQVMPLVLEKFLPIGIRGLVIAGLLAAFMSTFGATVNAAASYIVRDFWQPLVGKRTSQRGLVWAGYVATIAVVVVGTAIGFCADSIRQVWDWIMMALGAAFVVPNVLRWYWWRLNGSGYAAGTLAGISAALALPVGLEAANVCFAGGITGTDPAWQIRLMESLNLPYVAFPVVSTLSLIGCLAGTWLTRPTDEAILTSFYRTVRPFGFWGPVRRRAERSPEMFTDRSEGMLLAAVNVILACGVILSAYLAPMYLVCHRQIVALGWSAAALGGAVVLYFTWYRNLPVVQDSCCK